MQKKKTKRKLKRKLNQINLNWKKAAVIALIYNKRSNPLENQEKTLLDII